MFSIIYSKNQLERLWSTRRIKTYNCEHKMNKSVNHIYARSPLLVLLLLCIFSFSIYPLIQQAGQLNNTVKSISSPPAIAIETFESTSEGSAVETGYDHPSGQLLPNALSILCLYFINHLQSYAFIRAPLLYLLFSTPPPFL